MNNDFEILSKVIRERRSIFPASYITKDIPKEVIASILANANYAPTHKLTEPWRFHVFRNSGLHKLGAELSSLYKTHTAPDKFLQKKYDAMPVKIKQSACVIAISMQTHPDKLPEWEEVAAVACGVQNMWLSASSLGIGSYWSTPGTIKHLGPFLGLHPGEKCIGLFYMGYHEAEKQEANRTPIEDKVKWVE